MVRGPFFDENGVKRGAWSEEEDERLKSYVQSYGHPNWRQLPKLTGLARCGKSCRLRWMNYLRPNLKHGNYTPQEEEIIIKLHEQHGNKWSLIAENLPGRTDNDVKNHWHSQLKRRPKCKDSHRSINSELKAKKPNNSNNNSGEYSECDMMKVVAESHSILESSSLLCTQQIADQDNSASVVSIEDTTESTVNGSGSTEEESSEASCQTNSFLEFSGDFWTEPFILENTYDEYYNSDYQIGGTGDIFSYDGPELLY